VLLTTHYIEEAQRLADRVIVLADGRVVADATPDQRCPAWSVSRRSLDGIS
jgi:ABC-type multidrug transport system ATPase subunit